MLRKKEASFGGASDKSNVPTVKTKKMKDIDLSALSGLNESLEKEKKEVEKKNKPKQKSSCGCW